MLNDYNFVMENNVAPRHTTTVSIIIQDEAQAFVYGEVNQGFCFESDSMLELKGKLFIANWTDEGIVEESIGRNCLVTASEGCVVVFVCDNQEIVVLRDNTSKFVVKVIEDEITNTDRAKMGDHFVNNYRNVDEMNRRVQQYKTEDDPGQLEHHSMSLLLSYFAFQPSLFCSRPRAKWGQARPGGKGQHCQVTGSDGQRKVSENVARTKRTSVEGEGEEPHESEKAQFTRAEKDRLETGR